MARGKQTYKRPAKGKATAAEKIAKENASRGKTDGFGRPLGQPLPEHYTDADRVVFAAGEQAVALAEIEGAAALRPATVDDGLLVDPDGQTALDVDEAVADVPAEKATLELTGHEAKLLARSLAKQSKFLLKQAEVAKDENYLRAAQEFKSDAGIIVHSLLASLRQQRVLIPPTAEEALAGIHNHLRTILAPRMEHEFSAGREASLEDKGKKIAARPRVNLDTLCDHLARKVDAYARAVGESCYAFGVSGRTQTIDAALIGGLTSILADA